MAQLSDKNKKGFTLVEMLVAALIFSIAIAVSVNLFISAIQLHKYNLKYQNLLNQASYIMEYMSRSLRMAKKSDGTICADFSGKNYNYSLHSIEFVNSNDDQCWEFYLSGNNLRVKIGGSDYGLTSDNLIVNDFNLSVSGDTAGQQPKITFYFDIQAKEIVFHSTPRIRVQTSVSQRNLNQ
jgi:prepilin-type N-terminal cleavage/methylation domain-containing protein